MDNVTDDMLSTLITQINWEQLADKGWTVCRDFMPAGYLNSLRTELNDAWNGGQLKPAAIGSGKERKIISEIRSDHIRWLDPHNLSPIQFLYWQKIEGLRQELNQRFFLGLADYEAHFAVYPAGSYYRKHLDRLRDRDERVITCVLYLNFAWDPLHGGQLRIYDDSNACVDIQPEAGIFVCFRSDLIYHEVLPCQATRYSLTGWLRRQSKSLI
jgi:SM-20-related protein